MSNTWFRLYAEFSSDPKVQMLSEVNQRRLVMIFCIRCNGCVTLQDEEVAFHLRISNDEWCATKAEFVRKGFINEHGEIMNWDKRQYVSDSSAARVAKHREAKKLACNVTVTPPEQNRTEQKQSKSKPLAQPSACASSFLKFWESYPKKRSKGDAEKAWKSINPDEHLLGIILAAVQRAKTREDWAKDAGQFIPYPASWLRDKGWEDGHVVQLGTQQQAEPDVCGVCGSTATTKKIGRTWYCRDHDQYSERERAA